MSHYFYVGAGLRGCYMDDSGGIIRCDTRRELKAAVKWECDASREAYGYGGSKREVAATVAAAWRDRRRQRVQLPWAIGFGRTRQRYGADRPFGVFIGHATREDYLAQQEHGEG